MAEGGERRDPSTHRTPSQQRRHTRTYKAREDQKKARAQRNAARREMEKEGKVKKGDGKHVDHKKPIRSGGSNSKSNLRVQSASKNSGWRKDSKSKSKSKSKD